MHLPMHKESQMSIAFTYETLGKELPASLRIDVIVSTVVIPSETRAGVASTAIQKETQLLRSQTKF